MLRSQKTSAISVCTVLAAAVLTAAPAFADPESSDALAQAILTARSGSHCPALQLDPISIRAAQMANQETSDYIGLRSAAVPFTDPLPALRTIGFAGSKGMLLSGYGPTATEALHGLILQYMSFKPDCSYTQFGADAFRDHGGFNVASVILSDPTPAQP